MFCKNCGAPMKDGAKFCPKCGAKQEDGEQAGREQTGRARAGREQASTAAPSPEKPKKPKKKFPVWLLILPICLVIGILGALMAPKVLEAISGKGGAETEIAEKEDEGWEDGRKKDKEETEAETSEAEASGAETSAQETTQAQTAAQTTAAPTTAAPTPDTTSAWLLEGSADLTGYARVGIIQSGSTSNIEQENNQNGPEMAIDGDEVTSWQEGVEGPGIGETIYYKLDKEQPISYLTLKLGNWRNDKYFYANNRPRTLTITLDDYTFQITFPAEKREYVVQVDPPYPASYIQFQIDDVYKGSTYDDTCIAELGMYCKVGE